MSQTFFSVSLPSVDFEQINLETAGGPTLSTSSSVSCAHMATKLSTFASHQEISSLEQWSTTQTKISFMLKHQNTSQNWQGANFKAKVTGSFSSVTA